MTIVLGVVTIGLAVALVMVVRTLTDAHMKAEAAWADERRELLTRIQRPEFIPTSSTPFEFPDEPEDEYNLVGTIRHEPEGE